MWCLCFFDRNGKKDRLYNSEKTVATIVCHEVRIHEVKSRADISSLWSFLDSPDNNISKQERMFIAKDLNLHPSSHISKTIKDPQRPNPGKAPRPQGSQLGPPAGVALEVTWLSGHHGEGRR